MNNKAKIRFIIRAISVLLVIILIIFLFLNNSYRKGLPDYPDLQTVPIAVKDQIRSSGSKAFRNPSAENLGMLGMVYNSSGFYEKANQCYKLATRKNSLEWKWDYYSGYLNLELGESQASIENFNKVIERNSKNNLALYYTAEAYQNLGMIAKAEDLYKKIAAINNVKDIHTDTLRDIKFPLQIYASYRLAHIYINSNRLDSAETILKDIIDKQITFGPAYRLLGVVYTRQSDLTMGNKFTIRANDLPDYMPPADSLIDRIVLISRSDEYLLKQIDDEIRSGNYRWVLILCNHALNYLPENKYLISKSIFANFILGFNDQALPLLSRHLKYFSDDYTELMHLADLLFGKGYDIQAMSYFNQAKKIKPDNSRLALWLLERGMQDEATALLNEQLGRDPENVKILTDAADFMLRLGDNKMASGYIDHILRISPDNIEAKKLAGTLEERLGNLKVAMQLYEEALRSNPKDLSNIRYLSALYLHEKMWDKALDHFKRSLLSFPNEPFLLAGLGNLLLTCPDQKIRNVVEAKEYSERAFINYKSSPAIKISAGKDLATEIAISGD